MSESLLRIMKCTKIVWYIEKLQDIMVSTKLKKKLPKTRSEQEPTISIALCKLIVEKIGHRAVAVKKCCFLI